MRKPGEAGLAEWAQKIRALQRQVDEDEEEGHRMLEQEITASRLARVRHSTGYGRVPVDPAAGMLPLRLPPWRSTSSQPKRSHNLASRDPLSEILGIPKQFPMLSKRSLDWDWADEYAPVSAGPPSADR
ncbi:hypothetical protein BC826DRAFT_71284 [Russula brevipes]|nr:hypothetical protein BC826DRAFT_71284 [Russula brevipes]